jgi:putative flippase GtrA
MLVWGLGFYTGRVTSFLAAASFTWFCNRRFTFPEQRSAARAEWMRFVAANTIGGVVNYTVYAVLIGQGPPFTRHPGLAVAAGSLAGLVFNFTISRAFVFREKQSSRC